MGVLTAARKMAASSKQLGLDERGRRGQATSPPAVETEFVSVLNK